MAEQNTPIYEFAVQALSHTSYTRYENKLLMLIFKYFQQDFKDAINQQLQNHCLTFTPEELTSRVRHRKVELRYLEPRKGHYMRAKQGLISMSKKIITIPYMKSSKTLGLVSYPSLLKVNFTYEKKKCMANLEISIDLLKHYMSIDLGYHRLNLDTMFSFGSNATQQLWRLYFAYFAMGRSKINVEFIARVLTPKTIYDNYSIICKNLLEPAKREMDNAYKLGKCDIHFTYSPYYEPNSVHGKMPDKLIFSFFERSDEHPTGNRLLELNVAQKRYIVLLKQVWGVKPKVAEDLVKRIQVWMLPELDLMVENKQKYVDKMKVTKRPVLNPAGYIVKHVGEFLALKEKELGKMKKKMERNNPGGTNGQLF